MDIEEVIRREIERSDLNLKQIANRADVDYMALWRWHSRNTSSLNAIMAEHVYKALTGRTFTK